MLGSANRQNLIGLLGPGVVLGLLPIFATTLFLSALLLFWVQPMFTKMVLPLLGGTPAVWNTAMMFFQAMLLAGYGYAHLTTHLLRLRWQVALHLVVLVAATAVLPLGVADGWVPPSDGTPVLWLIGLYGASVGLPFFAISASAPLMQRWFSQSGHETADDPYFLYGASNVGSILALFAYPVVLEPALTLAGQAWAWTIGYAGLCVMIAACALKVFRAAGELGPRRPAGTVPIAILADGVGWVSRARWTLLAFIPSSLLLGVTTHITMDVASAPFLWVLPLSLYLLTFVITFARRPLLPHSWMLRVQPLFMIVVAVAFWATKPYYLLLPLHLAAFFVAAMVCHGELISRRPQTSHLTEFYLWMSFGGMLGGVFNALLAPMVLDSVAEYPLMLVAACLVRPWRNKNRSRPLRRIDWLAPGLAVGLLLVSELFLNQTLSSDSEFAIVLMFLILPLLAFLVRRRPAGLALAVGTLLVFGPLLMHRGETLIRDRSFFGVYSVRAQEFDYYVLTQGTTKHGAQYRDVLRRRLPTQYYYPTGPIGRVFAALDESRPPRRVGVVGLGGGAMSCYRRVGQEWTYYEIDPAVTALAQDLRYFYHLAECAPDARIVHGDARLSLQSEPDENFDLLVSDAFSSDSIPVHLVTREALELYFAKLAPNGVLAMHISNRIIDLEPVLAELAVELGLSARISHFRPTDEERANSALPAEWVVITRPGNLGFLDGDPGWSELRREPGTRPWTDDFSNIVGALRWW